MAPRTLQGRQMLVLPTKDIYLRMAIYTQCPGYQCNCFIGEIGVGETFSRFHKFENECRDWPRGKSIKLFSVITGATHPTNSAINKLRLALFFLPLTVLKFNCAKSVLNHEVGGKSVSSCWYRKSGIVSQNRKVFSP